VPIARLDRVRDKHIVAERDVPPEVGIGHALTAHEQNDDQEWESREDAGGTLMHRTDGSCKRNTASLEPPCGLLREECTALRGVARRLERHASRSHAVGNVAPTRPTSGVTILKYRYRDRDQERLARYRRLISC